MCWQKVNGVKVCVCVCVCVCGKSVVSVYCMEVQMLHHLLSIQSFICMCIYRITHNIPITLYLCVFIKDRVINKKALA